MNVDGVDGGGVSRSKIAIRGLGDTGADRYFNPGIA
jgi:hypothetical protein